MSRSGQRLIQSAKEAAAIARGEKNPARSFVPRDVDVRSIRGTLGLSQEAFASEFGFSVSQIRDWEQARTSPLGALRAYLLLIDRDPEIVRKVFKDARDAA